MIEIFDDAGAVLHRVDAPTLAGTSLANCYLRNAQLQDLDLQDVNFRDADLRGAYLSRSDLRGSKFDDTNLEGADLSEVNLSGMRIESFKTTFEGANLTGANLEKAWIANANLKSLTLVGTNLRGATLLNVELDGTKFAGVELKGARVFARSLEWASLRGADISNVGEFHGNCYKFITYDSATRWPPKYGLLADVLGNWNLICASAVAAVAGFIVGGALTIPWIGAFTAIGMSAAGLPWILWNWPGFTARWIGGDFFDHARWALVVLSGIAIFGHLGSDTTTRLDDFQASWTHGLLTHDVSVSFQGAKTKGQPIERVELSLLIYLQNGNTPKVHRYRELWRPGEVITFAIPADALIERVELTGRCQADGKPRDLFGAWVITR